MGVRDDFYTTLCEEFRKEPSSSFLFRYLQKKHVKKFSQASLGELLEEMERLASRKQKLYLNQRDHDWLWALGRRAGGEELRAALAHTRGEKAQCKQVLAALRSRPEIVTPKDVDELRKIVLTLMVHKDARTFLYDAGFSPDRNEVYPHRKKDHTLEMLDAWYEEMGFAMSPEASAGAKDDAEERRAWDTIIRLIQRKEEATELILPVQVDTRTGIGLYLAGTGCFTPAVKKEIEETRHQKYVFLCLGPTDFGRDEENIKKHEPTSYQLANRFQLTMSPLEDRVMYSVTLDAGKKQFASILKSELAYEFFCEQNSEWWDEEDLEATPKMLRRFFQAPGEVDWEELVAEGRRESAQELARNSSPKP